MAVALATSELGLDSAGRSVLTTTAPMFQSPDMHDGRDCRLTREPVVCIHPLPAG
jgi:hypothetical protein